VLLEQLRLLLVVGKLSLRGVSYLTF
jgi:hypothetical protein